MPRSLMSSSVPQVKHAFKRGRAPLTVLCTTVLAVLLSTGNAHAADCPNQAVYDMYTKLLNAQKRNDDPTARSYARQMWQLSDNAPTGNCKVRDFMQRLVESYPDPFQAKSEHAGFAMEALDADAKAPPRLPSAAQAAQQLGVEAN